jgi:hypothetical protein
MASRGTRSWATIAPSARRTASANEVAQVFSQTMSAADELKSGAD